LPAVPFPDEGEGEIDRCICDGPQSVLERLLIEAFLEGKGYRLEEVKNLPEELAKRLMREACTYASVKLAEVESKAQFKRDIHFDE